MWSPENIRALREHIGDTAATFAERIGVARQYVYRIESTDGPDQRQPSETLCRLLDVLALQSGFAAQILAAATSGKRTSGKERGK